MNNASQAAYPVSAKIERQVGIDGWGSIGLTKREAFAMAAMQGIISVGAAAYARGHVLETIGLPPDAEWNASVHFPMFVAIRAVAHADALLAELAKP